MKLVRPNDRSFTESAIHHDSEDLQVFTTISLTFGTGMTFSAIEVGFDRATIPGAYVGHSFCDLEHFHPQFVTGNPRVVEEGEFPKIATDVSPANSHSGSADESFAGTGLGWLGSVKLAKGFGGC
jgi:hypothetical protein